MLPLYVYGQKILCLRGKKRLIVFAAYYIQNLGSSWLTYLRSNPGAKVGIEAFTDPRNGLQGLLNEETRGRAGSSYVCPASCPC